MRCPACSKAYTSEAWFQKHVAKCRGAQPDRAPRAVDVDLSIPSPPRLVPTISDWAWASTFRVLDEGGRRLPRLYRKIPSALRVEAQRAFRLPLRRLHEDSMDMGAWTLFLMFSSWCFALPLRGGVAGHRVTRQRKARYLGGD